MIIVKILVRRNLINLINLMDLAAAKKKRPAWNGNAKSGVPSAAKISALLNELLWRIRSVSSHRGHRYLFKRLFRASIFHFVLFLGIQIHGRWHFPLDADNVKNPNSSWAWRLIENSSLSSSSGRLPINVNLFRLLSLLWVYIY